METFSCEAAPVWILPEQQTATKNEPQTDNWFMRKIIQSIIEGAPPTIIIGGPRRWGKSWLSLKIGEEIVKRCHEAKFAYRDRGLSTEKKYDLRNAQFDVSRQLLYQLKNVPELLSPPPPDGNGLPYGSVMISDETSVTAGALSFNSPIVKTIMGIHDTSAYRLISWILNVPGSILRTAYQLRETAEYFIQMQARGVGKVYTANPSVTGRVWIKTAGWLGYRNPWTKQIFTRVEPPSKETLRDYYVMKDFYFNRQLKRSEARLAELASQNMLGPYDDPSDYADSNNVMTMPNKRKNDIPKATDEGDEVFEV
jgi:hypothetical protein